MPDILVVFFQHRHIIEFVEAVLSYTVYFTDTDSDYRYGSLLVVDSDEMFQRLERKMSVYSAIN